MKYMILVFMLLSAYCRTKLEYSPNRSMTKILAEVENKIKIKAPLDSVLNIINSFKEAVNIEQVNHDDIWMAQQTECDSEADFRQREIQDAHVIQRDSSNQLNGCTQIKNRASQQFDVNNHQQFTAQQHFNIILNSADKEQSYYKSRSRDYADALHHIEEAQDILAATYQGRRSFVEITKVTQSMLQIAFNLKETQKFAPIFSLLARASSQEQLDDSLLERIAQMLESLRSYIQDSFNSYNDSFSETIGIFNQQKERIETILERLNQQNDRIQNKIDHSVACIGTQSAIQQAATIKLSRNQQLWDYAQSLCSTFSNEYNYATQARRNEIKLVSELETMVEKRFIQVDDEIQERDIRIKKQIQ